MSWDLFHRHWRRHLLVALFFCLTPRALEGASQTWTNELLAHFPFARDGKDLVSKSESALINTEFQGGTMFLNGQYENGPGNGFRAIAGIKNLSYESMTFSLDFYPLDFFPGRSPGTLVDILSRVTGWRSASGYRSDHENIIMGGSSYRWLGYRHKDGCLELTLNNQDFIHRFTNTLVASNEWHTLACSFDLKARRILTFLDGRQLPEVKLPEDFKLRVIGTERDPEDKEFTFSNYGNGGAFHGYAANLRVFARALTAATIQDFLAATMAERPTFKPPPEEVSKWPIAVLALFVVMVGGWIWSRRFRRAAQSGRSKLAQRYTSIRCDWFLASQDERRQMDAGRSQVHNALIDAFNILSRQQGKLGEDNSWRNKMGQDRKEIGDMGGYIVLFMALAAR